MTEALQKSLNVPAVEVLDRLGSQRFVSLLRRGGLKLDLPRGATPNLSVILGGAAVSLEGLVGAYTAFARGGVSGRPRYPARRAAGGGAHDERRRRLHHPRRARIRRPGGAHGRGRRRHAARHRLEDRHQLRLSRRLGGRRQRPLHGGVWVGRPDGTPNPGFFGANIAAPLLHELLALLPETPQARQRAGQRQRGRHLLAARSGGRADRTGPLPATPQCLAARGQRRAHLARPPRPQPAAAANTPLRRRLRWPLALQPWTGGATGGSQRGCPPQRGRESVQQAWQLRGLEDGERLHGVQGIGPLLSLRTEGGTGWRYCCLLDGQLVARTQAAQTLSLRLPPGSRAAHGAGRGGALRAAALQCALNAAPLRRVSAARARG
jgi:penicillin-binding protein 1C